MQGDHRSLVTLAVATALIVVAAPLAAPLAPAADVAVDRDAAADWIARARWSSTGTFVDFPDHIAFPHDSHITVDAFRAAGALDRIDARAAAEVASRMQDPVSGGFFDMAGAFMGPFTGETRHAVELTLDEGVPINGAAAARYLKARQNPDGGFSPRGSLSGGNLPSFLEATHDAVVGLHRLDALEPAIRDAVVQFLKTKQNPDGGWPMTMFQGDTVSTVSSTYHAVATLHLLGELDPATAARASAFVLTMQKPTGGFVNYHVLPLPCLSGFCQDFEELTVHATAHAILALRATGVLPVVALTTGPVHALWLAERQLADGRYAGAFEAYSDYDPPVTRFTVSTTLALEGLRALGATSFADEDAALDFLAAAQHDGTGGFGWWAGYISTYRDTEAALRALEPLGRLDVARPDALAATLAREQQDDGAIPEPGWQWEDRIDHTAFALLALARVDRLHAVDADAAAEWIATKQEPGSGFKEAGYTVATPEATRLAVAALAAVGRLDLVDADGVAAFFASIQQPDGRISTVGWWDYVSVYDTADALRTLATLGRLSAVDVDAAAGYLAGRQKASGAFPDLLEAHHAALGLAAAGQLDRIDGPATVAYLASFQTPRGGFAGEGFYVIPAMVRHAAAVEALDALADAGFA